MEHHSDVLSGHVSFADQPATSWLANFQRHSVPPGHTAPARRGSRTADVLTPRPPLPADGCAWEGGGGFDRVISAFVTTP